MELYQRSQTETNIQDDPAARELLRSAFEKTSRWGKDFPGFSADLVVNQNGKTTKGKVKIKSPKETEVTLEGLPAEDGLVKWAQNQIGMMAVHRAHRSFDESDGKYTLSFAEATADHPLGRQIAINGDGMSSRYRIKDDRIQQISRGMGKMKFTINIEEAMTTSDGKFLTTHYVVFYFSPEGAVTQVESFTDRPFELKGTYLPGYRRIISNDGGEVVVRELLFKNHQLL
ncbi:MAG: DUF3386 family protein [Nitrospirae bacterium]|nr:DUF3386 family protein [Candidatus Manganitrophaceae bacterium]